MSFIFNDSVNPIRLSLWVYVCVCVCERERVRLFLARQTEGENKETETGLNPYSVAECHVCPWPFSVFTNGTACAAGIKMLCEVGSPALTEKLFHRFC